MSDDDLRCHAGCSPAVIAYRIKPYPGKTPLSETGRRANGAPHIEIACASTDHQRQVSEAGVILDAKWIGNTTDHRRLKDD